MTKETHRGTFLKRAQEAEAHAAAAETDAGRQAWLQFAEGYRKMAQDADPTVNPDEPPKQ